MKRKCLIVCPAESAWSYNFTKLLTDKYDVTVFSYLPESESYRNRLLESGIKITTNSKLPLMLAGRYGRFRFATMLVIQFLKLRGFDIINFQYVEPVFVLACALIPGNARRMVISYWGSDLYHTETRVLRLIKSVVNRVKKVTFDNGDLLDEFNRVYPKNYARKGVVFLPLPLLSVIDTIRNEKSKSDWYEIDGRVIPSDKTIIAIGYNGRRMQQHLPVLEAISIFDSNIRDQICIILQVTYALEDDYKALLLSELDSTKMEYVLFDNYLSNEDVAKLRLITDIYINAQETDAFAGSVCEFMYAGTQLVNAKWLHYKEFDEYGFKYSEFDEFAQIPGLVKKAMDDKSSFESATNGEYVSRLRSVEACMSNWTELFDE